MGIDIDKERNTQLLDNYTFLVFSYDTEYLNLLYIFQKIS